jgi:triphosphatase
MQKRALDHQEIEWQFEAADLEPVDSWLQEHASGSGLAVVPGATKELIDTYYDTEDWRLYRAGYALRLRRDGKSAEATMKPLAPAEGALRRRREISEPLENGPKTPQRARGPVGERLRKLAGDRDLRPLFKVRTRRRSFALHFEGPSEKNGAVGEVALDEAEISGESEAPTLLSRVEVEVGADAELHDGVAELVDRMQDALGLRPTELSKFELGLSAAGLNPRGASDLGSEERAERSGEDGR